MRVSAKRDLTTAISLVSLVFTVPHVLEDFEAGIAASVGLSSPALACLLGAFLAFQSLGLVRLGQGRQAGWALTLGVGIIWVAGAVIEHARALLAGGFRGGALSIVWVAGLILTQAMAAILAWSGLRQARKD